MAAHLASTRSSRARWGRRRRESRTGRAVAVSSTAALLTGCLAGSNEHDADEVAASFADKPLLQYLQEAAQDADPHARLRAVMERLRRPDDEFLVRHADSSWVVGPVRNSTVSVTVHYYWEDKTFFPSRDWGLACREYTVSDTDTDTDTVAVTEVECPDGTRRIPGAGAVGWDWGSRED